MKKISIVFALVLALVGLISGCQDKQYSNLNFALREDRQTYKVTGGTIPEDGHLVIPATYRGKPVVEIETEAFRDSTLTRLTLPEGLTEIGSSAFYGCTGITEIKFPESLKNVGFYAFYGCTGITEIVIPDAVKAIGGSAFSDCMGLKKVTIGNGTVTIGTKAFFCCENLESVYIGDRVRSIGEYAFHKCLSLHTVRMPKDIEVIQKYAFRKCESLTTVYCSGQWKDWYLIRVEKGNEFLTGAGVMYDFTEGKLPESPCEHSFGQWMQLDGVLHQRTCTLCGAQATGNHAWSEGSCSVCFCTKTDEE